MAYLVLARKWRPQTFSDLVGQDHVSRTIGNAIAQNRVAHAFLFTGVRGVGKTTSARILAKALNCVKGPTASPCLECAPCVEIAAGVDVDVQEIDGASHTGVDAIREIQSGLPYLPQRDRSKILIVDEVHMLSSNAWNAFLKTLEEPPAHVKFIFATTEVNKIPITILSRCQRYDFKMISSQLIAERVRFILREEKIEADAAAVQIVAHEAAGSMRDALSILDQVIAFGGDSLKGEEVARVLGVADRQALHELSSAVVEARAADAIRNIDALANNGFDLFHVARDLLRRFRDLTIARVVDDPTGLLDLADAEQADVKALAAKATADDLSRLFQGMSRAVDEIARSSSPRASFEMAVVRLARRPPMMPVDALLERLGELERRLSGASSGPPGGGGPRPGGGGSGTSRSSGSATPSFSRVESPSRPTLSVVGGAARVEALAPSSAPDASADAAQVVHVATAPEQPSTLLDEAGLATIRRVVQRVREEQTRFASIVENGVVTRADAGGFDVAYERRSFMAAQASERSVTATLARAASRELGCVARVLLSDAPPVGTTLAQLASRAKNAALDGARRAATAHPAVQDVIAIFSAEVREVKLP